MCCNQPVSGSRCRYQADDRSRWYQFPYQVLIAAVLLSLTSSAFAGDGYYTWVDAQGRIHNTPVEQKATEDADVGDEAVPDGGEAEYLTEDELQRKLEKYDEDNPSFFIYVDPQGNVRSQTYDGDAEQAAVESAVSDEQAIIGWDTILAPPFRVAEAVTAASFCESFKGEFESAIKPLISIQLFDPVRYRSFLTGEGKRPAWYFNVGAGQSGKQRFLVLRLRGAEVKATLIGLNAEYKPLYFERDAFSVQHPETWHGVAYQEFKILIEDSEVSSFIFYPHLKPAEDLSLEIRWNNDAPPF